MTTSNAPSLQRYNTVAIILHWLIAILMIYMMFWGEALIKGSQTPGTNPQLHAELGTLILILSVLRLVWRLMNPPPPDVPMPAWQAKASHWLHWGFYAVIILTPLSGMAAMAHEIAGKHPDYANFTFFGLFPSPYFSVPGLGSIHGALPNIAILLLAIHVAAALKHQFIDKDNLLKRMWFH